LHEGGRGKKGAESEGMLGRKKGRTVTWPLLMSPEWPAPLYDPLEKEYE
jgi:hypothetical protein